MRLYTSELVKKYKSRTVVDHVSIDVNQGEIVGLLGPNGAGKTTTFYMIVGLIKPNEGRIFLESDQGQVSELTGLPVYRRAQLGVGYLAQEASVFRRLSVEDNIRAVLEMTSYSKEYQQERSYVKEAQAVAPEAARKHLPRMVNLRNDGTYRYTQGSTDIAITKRGDSYYVYDYESGLMSKALSRTETNRVLREIHANEQNYQNGVRQHTEAQNRLREQAAEIDTYARENISEYKNLSAAGQAAIRATIRQGRAAGVQISRD